jgi:hypothetical protein
MPEGLHAFDGVWGPSAAGKAFTATPDWQLTLLGSKYQGHIAGREIQVPPSTSQKVVPGPIAAAPRRASQVLDGNADDS